MSSSRAKLNNDSHKFTIEFKSALDEVRQDSMSDEKRIMSAFDDLKGFQFPFRQELV